MRRRFHGFRLHFAPLHSGGTVIRLRVTEAEVELFKRKAREAGCKSVSEYIRLRCIDGIGTMLENNTKE